MVCKMHVDAQPAGAACRETALQQIGPSLIPSILWGDIL
jgi:hypothetical protein